MIQNVFHYVDAEVLSDSTEKTFMKMLNIITGFKDW